MSMYEAMKNAGFTTTEMADRHEEIDRRDREHAAAREEQLKNEATKPRHGWKAQTAWQAKRKSPQPVSVRIGTYKIHTSIIVSIESVRAYSRLIRDEVETNQELSVSFSYGDEQVDHGTGRIYEGVFVNETAWDVPADVIEQIENFASRKPQVIDIIVDGNKTVAECGCVLSRQGSGYSEHACSRYCTTFSIRQNGTSVGPHRYYFTTRSFGRKVGYGDVKARATDVYDFRGGPKFYRVC